MNRAFAVLALACVTGAPAWVACDDPDTRRIRTAERIYGGNCESCHGPLASGRDPAVAYAGPDLTRIAERRGGWPATEEIASYIDGREHVEAHGPRTMPVWGDRLYAGWPEGDDREAARAGAIAMIVDMLEASQIP